MHYYQFNIGDYSSHTSHLSVIEDACYRRLLDYYYLHEKPITNDINLISRKLRLSEYSTDVERVLNEFFTLVEHGWINPRADDEIVLYKSKISQASKAGKASAIARAKAKLERSLNERCDSVQPNKKQETRNIYIAPIPPNLLKDFLKVRKAKRAGDLSETAFNGIASEASKAGLTPAEAIEICCARGWAGFKSTWDWGTPIVKKNGLSL